MHLRLIAPTQVAASAGATLSGTQGPKWIDRLPDTGAAQDRFINRSLRT